MSAIKGTVRDGKIVLDHPVDWPEGIKVMVSPLASSGENGAQKPLIVRGMTEEEQGDDPESIAHWLAEYDALEPLRMSEQEEADLQAWRQKMKAFNVEAMRRQMEEGVS